MSEREEPALNISESASLERGYRRLLRCTPGGSVRRTRTRSWAISRGRDAARFAFASFFLLLSLNVIIAQAQGAAGYAPADMIAAAAAWFVALVTVALIFVPASNRYFRQMAAPVAHPAG